MAFNSARLIRSWIGTGSGSSSSTPMSAQPSRSAVDARLCAATSTRQSPKCRRTASQSSRVSVSTSTASACKSCVKRRAESKSDVVCSASAMIPVRSRNRCDTVQSRFNLAKVVARSQDRFWVFAALLWNFGIDLHCTSTSGDNAGRDSKLSSKEEMAMHRDALASVLPHGGLPVGNTVCHDSILRTIGWTPMIVPSRVAKGLQAKVMVKVESANPGGSVKDRVALAMIAEAEHQGWLRPGGTIIEATAGNTGVGLAMVAAVKGYRCIFVLPDKMSAEKIALLKAYGAEVVITPTNVSPDAPESYNGVADRLAREIPGAWRPNQFTN